MTTLHGVAEGLPARAGAVASAVRTGLGALLILTRGGRSAEEMLESLSQLRELPQFVDDYVAMEVLLERIADDAAPLLNPQGRFDTPLDALLYANADLVGAAAGGAGGAGGLNFEPALEHLIEQVQQEIWRRLPDIHHVALMEVTRTMRRLADPQTLATCVTPLTRESERSDQLKALVADLARRAQRLTDEHRNGDVMVGDLPTLVVAMGLSGPLSCGYVKLSPINAATLLAEALPVARADQGESEWPEVAVAAKTLGLSPASLVAAASARPDEVGSLVASSLATLPQQDQAWRESHLPAPRDAVPDSSTRPVGFSTTTAVNPHDPRRGDGKSR